MNDKKPFYLLVVLWGAEHRRIFLDLALSSLLAEDNIPALGNKSSQNRLLIATTKEDWDALKQDIIFKKAEEFITPEWIELRYCDDGDKMLKMSPGHKALTDRAFNDGAWGAHPVPKRHLFERYAKIRPGKCAKRCSCCSYGGGSVRI